MNGKLFYRPSDSKLSLLFALVEWCSKKHLDLERSTETNKQKTKQNQRLNTEGNSEFRFPRLVESLIWNGRKVEMRK